MAAITPPHLLEEQSLRLNRCVESIQKFASSQSSEEAISRAAQLGPEKLLYNLYMTGRANSLCELGGRISSLPYTPADNEGLLESFRQLNIEMTLPSSDPNLRLQMVKKIISLLERAFLEIKEIHNS